MNTDDELAQAFFSLTITINNSGFKFMGFNTTFNNISAISCQSVLLVEETGVL